MNIFKSIKHKRWFIKLTNWEYWSMNTIYVPVVWYYIWLSFKARSFYFFNAANPSIEYGGFLMESKWKIQELLPVKFAPQTSIVYKTDNTETILGTASKHQYPFICKPDTGSRGRGVAVIKNTNELLAYYQQCPGDFLIQEKIDYALEAGFFYVRMPGEKKGFITGIVEKKFLVVTGDGRHTINELILANPRYILQHAALKKMLGNELHQVLAKNEQKVLAPYGNHARGCLFLDATYRVNAKLENAIDHICRQVSGFYFGRLDVKFESWELLEEGKALSIIELNGSGSEPTHMYDPRHSIFFAWKEIIRHWNFLYLVSRANNAAGVAYLTAGEAKKMYRDNKMLDLKMDNFLFAMPEENHTTKNSGHLSAAYTELA